MVMYALIALGTPNALAEKRLAMVFELQGRGWSYATPAGAMTRTFVKDLAEAHVLSPDDGGFADEPDYSHDDYLRHCYGFADSREAAAALIKTELKEAAQIAGVRRWEAEFQIAEEPWIVCTSDDEDPG